MNPLAGTISYLPGGHAKIISGGTRNAIKLSRPWQVPLETIVKPETCPFCHKAQDEIPLSPDLPKGYRLLNNLYTPHQAHRLIIPSTCWPVEKMQDWGGTECMTDILTIASAITREDDEETLLCGFIGPQAGQNLGHPHWHVFNIFVDKPLSSGDLLGYANNPQIQVFEKDNWIVAAGGARAGECLIVPKRTKPFKGEDTLASLAETMIELVDLGNKKFESAEGLAPPYGLGVRIGKDRTVRWVEYNPVLSNWCLLENAIAPMEGTPIALPWPHSTTAEYLRG